MLLACYRIIWCLLWNFTNTNNEDFVSHLCPQPLLKEELLLLLDILIDCFILNRIVQVLLDQENSQGWRSWMILVKKLHSCRGNNCELFTMSWCRTPESVCSTDVLIYFLLVILSLFVAIIGDEFPSGTLQTSEDSWWAKMAFLKNNWYLCTFSPLKNTWEYRLAFLSAWCFQIHI